MPSTQRASRMMLCDPPWVPVKHSYPFPPTNKKSRSPSVGVVGCVLWSCRGYDLFVRFGRCRPSYGRDAPWYAGERMDLGSTDRVGGGLCNSGRLSQVRALSGAGLRVIISFLPPAGGPTSLRTFVYWILSSSGLKCCASGVVARAGTTFSSSNWLQSNGSARFLTCHGMPLAHGRRRPPQDASKCMDFQGCTVMTRARASPHRALRTVAPGRSVPSRCCAYAPF